jgi:hypothetical protein
VNSTNIEVYIRDRLTSEELRDIRLFIRRAKEYQESKLLRDRGFKIHMNVKYEKGSALKFTTTLPEEDLLKSFLMSFRFFYLEKEPSNFLHILNILKRKSENDLVVQQLDKYKKQWNGAFEREQYSIKINGVLLTSKYMMDLWFNAHYFHSDSNKQEKLNELNNLLSQEGSKYLLVDSVLLATEAIFNVAKSVEQLEN